mgnify:FL=1
MKKGITFVAVMVTVAIMFILVSTVTISAINVINNSQKTKLATELAYVKEAVDNYYTTYNTYPIDESVTVKLNEVEDVDKNQFEGEDGYTSDSIVLYVINKEKLGITETVYGNGNVANKDIYVFSKKTDRVYYLKGLKIGSKTYYTLTDNLKKIINYEESNFNSSDEENNTSRENNINIELGEKKILISADESEKHYYIPVKITDDLGEIKIKKFEREIFSSDEEAKIYFKTNGIELQEDIIELNEDTKGITVYAEDNYGNFAINSNICVAVIPDGFVASQASGETDVNKGLVIYEGTEPVTDENVDIARTTRNQFVWVPVNDLSKFIREDGYSEGNKQGYSLETLEPYKEDGADASEETEYNAMYESIKKYHGFYISRYEASKSSDGKAQSLKNKQPWENIIWGNTMTDLSGGAVEAARAVYPSTTSSSGSAVSTLVYGVQWDQTVRWISQTDDSNKNIAKDSTGKGSYCDVSNYVAISTGSNETYKQNNIYDMCGNLAEWTMEAPEKFSRSIRGGELTRTGLMAPISNRDGYLPSITWECIGFRFALYVKV